MIEFPRFIKWDAPENTNLFMKFANGTGVCPGRAPYKYAGLYAADFTGATYAL